MRIDKLPNVDEFRNKKEKKEGRVSKAEDDDVEEEEEDDAMECVW